MSSRYRYNSQSYYNRSSGGQTNNPRVINRPYGIGYSSNQATNVQTWAYNLSHAGYYVNDSLESMANQLHKNGYYVSKEPPIQKFNITKVVPINRDVNTYGVNINSFSYSSSNSRPDLYSDQLLIQIKVIDNYYILTLFYSDSKQSGDVYPGSYYKVLSSTDSGLDFYDNDNNRLFTLIDYTENDVGVSRLYLYFDHFQIELPNN